MKAAFTICTNNYLAQAKILSESVKKYAPDYVFYLFLADEFDPDINYVDFNQMKFVSAKSLPIDFFSLVERYNIIELNTCIKGSCFKYLFDDKGAEFVHYFDPDIELFAPISLLDIEFEHAPILLTPHVMSPIAWQDGSPNENLFLNHGLYNLGYLGLKKDETVSAFLDWWENRTLTMGYYRTRQGLFVDQLWINYVPLFYPESTKILFNPGCNMGPWNLHERTLSEKNSHYYVNQRFELIFYHFSSYKYNQHEISANYRYTFVTNPDVRPLYDLYQQKMLNAGVELYSEKRWAYKKNDSWISRLLKRK